MIVARKQCNKARIIVEMPAIRANFKPKYRKSFSGILLSEHFLFFRIRFTLEYDIKLRSCLSKVFRTVDIQKRNDWGYVIFTNSAEYQHVGCIYEY